MSCLIVALKYPRFFSKDYEKAIQRKLSTPDTLNWNGDRYVALENLQFHTTKIAQGLHHLSSTTHHTSSIKNVELAIKDLVQEVTLNDYFNPAAFSNRLDNSFRQLKRDIEQNTWQIHVNLVLNIVSTAAGLIGAVVSLSCIGLMDLPYSVIIASASLLLLAIGAYNAYIHSSLKQNFQLQDIQTGINFIKAYPVIAPPPVNEGVSLISAPPSY